MMKYHPKAPWWGKGLCQVTVPCHWVLSKIHLGTRIEQKPGGRSLLRNHGGVLPTGFLFMACSSCFLTALKTTSTGEALSIVCWTLPYQSSIKKMLLWSGLVLSCSFLLSIDSGLWQTDVKFSQHHNFPYVSGWLFSTSYIISKG